MSAKKNFKLITSAIMIFSNIYTYAQETLEKHPPVNTAIIKIDPTRKTGKVNPLIFGNNIEAANGKDIFSDKDTEQPLNGQGAWNTKADEPIPEVVYIAKEVRMGMLRYPGGCLTHNFDWRQAVGSKESRTYFKFGIDEYIKLCRAIGAEPLMTVSEICTPEDAADLVEYLNMPATPQYPWAMKRAEWGNKEPYHVKYFEMANESDHGNHNVKPPLRRGAGEYAHWYLTCADAMRKLDANILIGGHAGTGTPVDDPWNITVLKQAGTKMDFFAIHTYAVGGRADDLLTPMLGCMASTDQLIAKLADYRTLIKKETGKNIPLAITEFNVGIAGSKPAPLRFSFGAALFCADYMREMFKPENNIAFANYWHFLNGYWGYVKCKTQDGKTTISTTAAYPVFKLFGQHTGTEMIECKVSNEPKLEFSGFNAAYATQKNFNLEEKIIREIPFALTNGGKAEFSIETTGKNSFEVNINKLNGDSYFSFPDFPILPGMHYIISCELRTIPKHGTLAAGIGIIDSRGWDKVKSGCGVQIPAKEEWNILKTGMNSRKNAKNLNIVLRLLSGHDFSGKIEFKNIKITEIEPKSFPPYSAITAFASIVETPGIIKLIVFNKHHKDDIPVKVMLNEIKSVKRWTVSAPDFATTAHSSNAAFEHISGKQINNIDQDGFKLMIPARSINAFEIIYK